MTAEIATATLSTDEARRLTDRIRLALDRVSTAWADLAERIAEAYQRRADLALGYDSWAEYAEAELRPAEGIAADVRRQLVGLLSAEGMSTRAIAPTVGVTDRQVRRDVGHHVPPASQPSSVSRPTIATAQGVVIAEGRRVEAPQSPVMVRDDAPGGDSVAPVEQRRAGAPTPSAPRTITGLDGKTYTRPTPTAPRRAPLRDAFRDAALDLDKIVSRFERLASDDRLARNQSEVARYANDLTRACDALQRVAQAITTT